MWDAAKPWQNAEAQPQTRDQEQCSRTTRLWQKKHQLIRTINS